MKIQCFTCGKTVSTELPDGTIFRGIAECPECIERDTSQEVQRNEAFKAGFSFGCKEQYEQDFPDVGFRLDRDVNYYWDIYEAENE